MSNEKRLPDSTYSSEYPYNQTTVSRSGHEKHIDDTPGHERIREGHKSGTYWEVAEDGRRVTLIVGDDYQYVNGGLTLTIDNNGDIKIGGNLRLVVEGDLYAEVDKNSYVISKKDSTVVTLGNSVQMIGKDSYTKVKGSMHTSVNGNMNAEVKGSLECGVTGDASIVSKGDIDLEGKQIRISATGACTITGNPVNVVQ